jgi:DNA polymerase-3 subunit gamma/tau
VCRDFLAGKDMDVEEIDGASHRRIEDVRELRERVAYRPARGAYRVFIIDEVHMLTREAFNALLKTLEEPPAHVVFILATTEPHKVPETIRSRCQALTFRRIGEGDIIRRLGQICAAEEAEVAPQILAEIAASVRGGMRDAESILERVLTLLRGGDGDVTVADLRRFLGRVGHGRALIVVEHLLGADLAGLLGDAAAVAEAGLAEGEFLGEVVDGLREVVLLKVAGRDTPLLDATAETRERLAALGEGADLQVLLAMIRVGLEARSRMRHIEDRRVLLELALLQMARATELADLGTLLAAFQGAPPPPPPAAGKGAPPAAGGPPSRGAEEATPGGGGQPGEGKDRQALLLEVVGRVCPTLADRLSRAKVMAQGALWQIQVPDLGLMEADRFAQPEARKKLGRAVERELKERLDVRILPLRQPRRARKEGTVDSPRVQRIRERFGGKVLEQEQRALFPETKGEGEENGTQAED